MKLPTTGPVVAFRDLVLAAVFAGLLGLVLKVMWLIFRFGWNLVP